MYTHTDIYIHLFLIYIPVHTYICAPSYIHTYTHVNTSNQLKTEAMKAIPGIASGHFINIIITAVVVCIFFTNNNSLRVFKLENFKIAAKGKEEQVHRSEIC